MVSGARQQERDRAHEEAGPVLVIAADVADAREARVLADALSGLPVWYKIGLELFIAEGPEIVREFLAGDFPVFLDLKFHDIPHTVRGATRSATLLGARMTTLHVDGGRAMCLAAVQGREEGRGALGRKSGPLLMGVTALTSEQGDTAAMRAKVVERALLAKEYGLDGVVCSGREAAAVKQACGRDFLCLCPGIRFASHELDDQARICIPAEAVLAGADFLVMGRPVLKAADRAEAARKALREIHDAWRQRKAGGG